MKDHMGFAKLCAQYAMSIGKAMDSVETAAAGRFMVAIPKRALRALCADQLDEGEYGAVKRDAFNLLRSLATDKGWGEVSLDDNGSDYWLQFRRSR